MTDHSTFFQHSNDQYARADTLAIVFLSVNAENAMSVDANLGLAHRAH